MPGKLCNGFLEANMGAGRLSTSKAFCEGIQYRSEGTALEKPSADNPHAPVDIYNPDFDSWHEGWSVANDAAGGAMSKDAAPCCATPQTVIAA